MLVEQRDKTSHRGNSVFLRGVRQHADKRVSCLYSKGTGNPQIDDMVYLFQLRIGLPSVPVHAEMITTGTFAQYKDNNGLIRPALGG